MPPPSALPSTYMSGTTPSCSMAKVSPVRPRPDWISSAMNSTLRVVQSARTPGEVARPAAPARRPRPGSAPAARRPCSSSIAAASAARSPYGTIRKPGVYGPKSSRASGSVEKLTIVVVRPWKLSVRDDDLGLAVRHALDLVAPLAGHLDRGLHRLGAGVHRQHQVLAAQLGQPVAEVGELVVHERAAGQREPVELGVRGGDQRRVPVAEVQRRVAGQAVQVAAAVDVGDPGALGRRRSPPAAGGSCARSSARPRPARRASAESTIGHGPNLQRAALRSAAGLAQLGHVDPDGLVAALAQRGGQRGGLHRQHHGAAVADRVEAEHLGVGRRWR